MTANASAHKLQILIGSEDWSRSLVSFDAGQDQRSMNGLILTTGTLVLGSVIGIPGSLNPRSADGRTRWWRGQLIQVWCTDSSGTLVKHRHGHLYILKAPLPPQDGTLTIDLGCIMSLRNFAQPDDDKSGVEPGVYRDRTEIVNSLLSAAGCPNCIDEIPDYPLNTPQPKQGGSYVEQAGLIAFGGLASLYQDGNGNIRVASNRLNVSESVEAITIGHDEVNYEASEGSETPCEIIKCVGAEKTLIDNWTTERSISEEYGPAAIVDPGAGNRVILLKRTETEETTNDDGKRRTELVQAPAGIVAPDAFKKSLRIVLDSYTEELHRYEDYATATQGGTPSTAAKLWKILTTVQRLFPAAAPEHYETFDKIRKEFWQYQVVFSSDTTLEFRYTPDELIERTTQTTLEPRAAIVGSEETENPVYMDISQVDTLEYHRRTPRIGKKIQTFVQVVARAFPNLELEEAQPLDRLFQKLALLTKSRRIDTSNSGQCNPPQAERKPERWTEEEKPIEAEARFAIAPLDAIHQDRERTIQLDGGVVSTDQLSKIAQIKGLELIGQAQGVTLQIPLLDVFLNSSDPFMLLDVVEPDGTVLKILTNGIQISHDPNSALVGLTGIWLGNAQFGQADRIDPPYYSATVQGDLVIPTPPALSLEYRSGGISGGYIRNLPYIPQTYSDTYRGGGISGGYTQSALPRSAVVDEFGNPVVDEFGNPVVE